MLSKYIVLLMMIFGGLTQATNNRTTPPMGYLAYTQFECWISFDSLTEQLNALKSHDGGLKLSLMESGYDHFVLDDCW